MTILAIRGSVLHMLGAPGSAGAHEYFPDGVLLVEDGHVVQAGPRASVAIPKGAEVHGRVGALIVPGLVDTHIHYPQVDIVAAHGRDLLAWLDAYTFPAETRFIDEAHATDTARFFLDELLRHGTTTALVYATVHRVSVDALFREAFARNMRLFTGKLLMDRNCPENLRDTAAEGEADTRDLIKAWHGRGRLGYAVTPRYAVTSSDDQLMRAGRVLADHPGVLLHTHLSENRRELERVRALYPDASDYVDVYDRFGLVTDRSVFAHGVHLDKRERRRLAEAGAAIAFCPTSNLFLGSGLFDAAAALADGLKLGLGTDIGAGTSFSLLQTMNEAYKVGALAGTFLEPLRLFHLATLGGAEALNLDTRIGNFAPGKEADFLVLDRAATPLLARRLATCRTIEEELFVFAMLGDDRAIAETWLAGRCAHARQERHP